MKQYLIYFNRSARFQPQELVFVGTVEAHNRYQALRKAQMQEFTYTEISIEGFGTHYPYIVKNSIV